MDLQEQKVTNKKQLQLTPIEGTPFKHATDGEQNYLTCGKIILKTSRNVEETREWLEKKPWGAIGLFIEALINEMTNNKEE